MQVPHGGTLVDLFTGASADGADFTIELNDRQSCDVELLCNGGFSPLTGFMTEEVPFYYTQHGKCFRLPLSTRRCSDAP